MPQKEQATLEKTAKTIFSARSPDSTDPEYTNYIHQILMQAGGLQFADQCRTLPHQIEGHGGKNLEEFVQANPRALPSRLQFGDQLCAIQDWSKNFDQLTVDEFRALALIRLSACS